MPAKGSIGKFYKRHTFLSKDLWRKYKKQTSSKISWKDFCAIISTSLEETRNWVVREPIGFQFPYKLGNLAVNTFKTYGDFRTYTNTRTIDGKPIKNHNLHTNGYCYRLQLFLLTRAHQERRLYWYFDAERKFDRELGKMLKGNNYPNYNNFMQDHFIKKIVRE